jgi:hypothetical protein
MIIIIIIIIIGKDTISFIQGIYTYIPETDHVPKEYNVAAILSLLFVAPISLAPVLAIIIIIIESVVPIKSVGCLRVLSTSAYQLPETVVHSNFSPLLW